MGKNPGKEFETSFQQSAKEQNIYIYRIKDVPPIMLKPNSKISKNDFDFFIYKKPNLFPVEFKSTGQKSISFDEKIIKKHQMKALEESNSHDGVIAGFIFNFRNYDNYTCFIHIQDFLKIKYVSENKVKDHEFKSKLNESSIGLDICKEVGIEIKHIKKKVKYRYYVNKLLDELIKKYGDGEEKK